MIDLHSHFLPGIDDGAKTIEESIEMLSDSASQGVKICVATPHCAIHHEDSIDSFLSHRKKSMNKLNEAILAASASVPELIMGAEVYLDNDISEHKDIAKLCIENTNYLLLEFPHSGVPSRSFDWIYELTLCNIKPIIAHIDRYPQREAIIKSLSGLNVIYQINSSNFLSFSGRRIIHSLLKHNVTYIVSSDMHNNTTRPCRMHDAYKRAKKMLPEICDDLFFNLAKLILE